MTKPHDRKDHRADENDLDRDRDETPTEDVEPNPPHTTSGKITAPKFGSAGSGGAELEPGPPRP